MSDTTPTTIKGGTEQTTRPDKLSVEFFHIYTDETIGKRHTKGLEYLKTIEQAWDFPYERILLIDDYNPLTQQLTAKDILSYLDEQGMPPDYWAYEKDLLPHAKKLLALITSPRLKKNYHNYIIKNKKYPCSLLVATWYLVRLGKLGRPDMIKTTPGSPPYEPSTRLLNILPADYRGVEKRALDIIRRSKFSQEVHQIQDLFYAAEPAQNTDLF